MRKITVQLVAVLSLLALAGCQPTTSTPAAGPRPTISPTSAPVQVSLFAASNQNTVVALNPADGSVRWQHPVALAGGALSTLLAVQDAVFVEAGQTLTALNASDGSERWHVSPSGRLLAVGIGIALTVYGTTLSALRTMDGKQLWSVPIGQDSGSASIAGDVVYATNESGPDSTLYALDARNGKERWQFQQAGVMNVQAVTQESVYVTREPFGGASSALFALNRSDGKVRWSLVSPNTDSFRGPTEVHGAVYVALDGRDNNGCTESPMTDPPGTLHALSASDGKTLWQSHPSQAGLVYVEPAVDQSAVYSADHQSAYAFNTADGQQLWRSQILQGADAQLTNIEQPIIAGSLIYLSVIGCGLAQTVPVSFWALNKSDGHVVWHYQGSHPNDVRANPLVVNGVVYVPTATGGVAALAGSDGTQIWQSSSPLTSLVSNAG
jgi:outer membrane protein assembly factor BamB